MWNACCGRPGCRATPQNNCSHRLSSCKWSDAQKLDRLKCFIVWMQIAFFWMRRCRRGQSGREFVAQGFSPQQFIGKMAFAECEHVRKGYSGQFMNKIGNGLDLNLVDFVLWNRWAKSNWHRHTVGPLPSIYVGQCLLLSRPKGRQSTQCVDHQQ